MELGPVAHHEHDAAPRFTPSAASPAAARATSSASRVVGPLPGLVERIGEGDDVAVGGDRGEESAGHRVRGRPWRRVQVRRRRAGCDGPSAPAHLTRRSIRSVRSQGVAMPTAVIVDAIRTPLGKRNGRLKDWHPVDLAAETLNALVDRTGIDPGLVDDVVMGCVMQVGEQGVNIARNAVLAAGWPETVPGTTVDRQCGSSPAGRPLRRPGRDRRRLRRRRRRRRRGHDPRADGRLDGGRQVRLPVRARRSAPATSRSAAWCRRASRPR